MADAVQARIEREARFASDVSHELRSPITALAAAAEVIDGRRGELPDRTQQALDVVVGQVRRFDAMVIDLLELSRIDAGATDLHTEEVDLEALCRRIAARNGFAELPIDVTRAPAPTAPPSPRVIDKMRFERIVANLLENAAHHGGGPVRISIEPTDGPFLLVAVEDAGPGVARGERARIFERFARGSAARHRVGTGLGLALVAEHATAQGGEAWVEDRPGGGARFVVRVPKAVAMNRHVIYACAALVLVAACGVVGRWPARADRQRRPVRARHHHHVDVDDDAPSTTRSRRPSRSRRRRWRRRRPSPPTRSTCTSSTATGWSPSPSPSPATPRRRAS